MSFHILPVGRLGNIMFSFYIFTILQDKYPNHKIYIYDNYIIFVMPIPPLSSSGTILFVNPLPVTSAKSGLTEKTKHKATLFLLIRTCCVTKVY